MNHSLTCKFLKIFLHSFLIIILALLFNNHKTSNLRTTQFDKTNKQNTAHSLALINLIHSIRMVFGIRKKIQNKPAINFPFHFQFEKKIKFFFAEKFLLSLKREIFHLNLLVTTNDMWMDRPIDR